MKIVVSFFFCTLAMWGLLHYVMFAGLTEQANLSGMAVCAIIFGVVGSLLIYNLEPLFNVDFNRPLRALADLLKAAADKIRERN